MSLPENIVRLASATMLALSLFLPTTARPSPAGAEPASADLREASEAMDEWRGDPDAVAKMKAALERARQGMVETPALLREEARFVIIEAQSQARLSEPEAWVPAERKLRRALDLDPKYAPAHVLLGHLYVITRQPEKARAALERADELGSKDAWLDLNWSDLLRLEGNHADAIPRCRRVAKRRDITRKALEAAQTCLLGSYVATGKLDDADALHRERIEADAEDATVHADYARFLLCRRRDIDASTRVAAQSIRLGDQRWPSVVLAAALYTQWSEDHHAGDADAAAKSWRAASRFPVPDPAAVAGVVCGRDAAMRMRYALRDEHRGVIVPAASAVVLASEQAPDGIGGIFGFRVAGVGRDKGEFFLNSKEDYRDPACLTIRFSEAAANEFHRRHGEFPDVFLKGKDVTVVGEARRRRIDFVTFGLPSDKYYYQTHVDVTDAEQVRIFDHAATPPPDAPATSDV